MRDSIGVMFAFTFCAIAVLVAFLGRGRRGQGFMIICLVAFALVALVRERITELAVSYNQFHVTLSRVEARLDQIADALDSLYVIQEVRSIAPDDSFTLDYDPVPKSVKILCGPFTWLARSDWGFELQGRKITITNKDLFRSITPRLNGGIFGRICSEGYTAGYEIGLTKRWSEPPPVVHLHCR